MTDIKRLNYFNSQFLVERDFNDEQAYHLGMRRRLNRSLHTFGVADGGLVVTKTGSKEVSVGAGMAIDKDGREIVLLDPAVVPLNAFAANADVFLSIQYRDVQDPVDHYTAGGVENYIRWTERPDVKASTIQPPTDGSVIPLARVHLDANGDVTTTDQSIRPVASSKIDPGSSLQVNSLTASSLQVNSLAVSGNASFGGRLGVGTTTPRYPLSVGGNLANTKLAIWDGGANGVAFGLGAQNGQFRLHLNQQSDRFSFLNGANGSEVATITGDGNAGLGVSNPTRKLEIAGSDGNLLWVGASTGSSANIELSGHVQLRESGSDNLAYFQARDDSSNRDIGLRLRTQKAGPTAPSITEAVTITPNGNISNPNWSIRQLQGMDSLPPQGLPFEKGHGTLVIFASGSGFASNPSMIGMRVLIDDSEVGRAQCFTNEPLSHKSFVANAIVVRDIEAGPHRLRLELLPPTGADANDRYSVTIMELPF
ncbi:MAG TPA: hypothetical protein VL334_20435 [Anaerolineae bacterium]|nr:hypothetical protein [Anaerolineae bacterium]